MANPRTHPHKSCEFMALAEGTGERIQRGHGLPANTDSHGRLHTMCGRPVGLQRARGTWAVALSPRHAARGQGRATRPQHSTCFIGRDTSEARHRSSHSPQLVVVCVSGRCRGGRFAQYLRASPSSMVSTRETPSPGSSPNRMLIPCTETTSSNTSRSSSSSFRVHPPPPTCLRRRAWYAKPLAMAMQIATGKPMVSPRTQALAALQKRN